MPSSGDANRSCAVGSLVCRALCKGLHGCINGPDAKVGGDEGKIISIVQQRKRDAKVPDAEVLDVGPVLLDEAVTVERIFDALTGPYCFVPARIIVPAALGDVDRL